MRMIAALRSKTETMKRKKVPTHLIEVVPVLDVSDLLGRHERTALLIFTPYIIIYASPLVIDLALQLI